MRKRFSNGSFRVKTPNQSNTTPHKLATEYKKNQISLWSQTHAIKELNQNAIKFGTGTNTGRVRYTRF